MPVDQSVRNIPEPADAKLERQIKLLNSIHTLLKTSTRTTVDDIIDAANTIKAMQQLSSK
ncbi:hypothetical protein AAS21_gp082 [Pantoea phage vB_PagS_AAS21]|uniref:Uncharacterized protein n=1 Tax=Pantoea phage vB_PagS_AAS21 TaxID=2575261 RepID=A0A4Y5P1I2_9CAUD|nr:hypothetical protein AAS21_gp082 [Pantoea phage vB_PagS_AAS21]